MADKNMDSGGMFKATGSNLTKAAKEGTLFGAGTHTEYTGGTGAAPNADLQVAEDDTDQLQAIAEGADPEAVRQAAELERQKRAYNPADFENLRTQSSVFSQREITEQQLAEVRARNEAALAEQRRNEQHSKTKRTALWVAFSVFILTILLLGIWVLLNALGFLDNVVPDAEPETPEPTAVLPTVDGYSCETALCGKVADLPDGRIILRDHAYYTYDTTTGERNLTTINQEESYTVVSFTWRSKIYLTLKQNVGQTALYSVTENRYVTDAIYDKFIIDINDANYNEMHWIEDSYILARSNNRYQLINLKGGNVVMQGTKRIFVHDGFYFGYEDNGRRFVFNGSGRQLLVAKSSDRLFTKNGILVVVDDNQSADCYDVNGEDVDSDNPVAAEVDDIDTEDLISVLRARGDYYNIPDSD